MSADRWLLDYSPQGLREAHCHFRRFPELVSYQSIAAACGVDLLHRGAADPLMTGRCCQLSSELLDVHWVRRKNQAGVTGLAELSPDSDAIP